MTRIIFAAVAAATFVVPSAFAAQPSFVSDGSVSVCTTASFPPLTFKENPGDTRPTGIDVEIAEALAKAWNATATYTTTDFAGLLPTLGAGRCGIMLSAPEMLSGKTLALEAGAYYKQDQVDPLNKVFEAEGKPLIAIQDYPTQQAAYQQVMVGRVDATLTEEAEGAYRVAQAKDQLKVAYTWQSDFTYGIYLRRNADDLANVRAVLMKLSEDGFFKGLAEKYGLDASAFDVDHDS